MRSRAFTLIELLVVIALIGVVSAIVIASLNAPRTKGADAAIKEQLHSIASEAEIFYYGAGANSYGSATNSCTAPAAIFNVDAIIKQSLVTVSQANGLAVGSGSKCTVSVGGTTYAVLAQLTTQDATLCPGPPPNTVFWCIDSTGIARNECSASFSGGLCQ